VRLIVLILACVCAYQQWRFHVLVHQLQVDQQIAEDYVNGYPPVPNLPREWALFNLMHPQEQ